MRAAVMTAPGTPLEVLDLDMLPLAPGRILVRTGAAPFCVTDVMNADGVFGKVPRPSSATPPPAWSRNWART
ncbi:hypothetical protein [Thermocatellispora tengchongensis]|uniref:hypothetical protein n=1 Tax=Thermocatellispora tengchongensis TaxID=1073253 RepID=UPI00363C31D1